MAYSYEEKLENLNVSFEESIELCTFDTEEDEKKLQDKLNNLNISYLDDSVEGIIFN